MFDKHERYMFRIISVQQLSIWFSYSFILMNCLFYLFRYLTDDKSIIQLLLFVIIIIF